MPHNITVLGKWLRTFRLLHDLRLKDMADKIEMSSANLSGIETGRKPVPSSLLTKLVKAYRLNEPQINDLKKAAIQSIDDFKLSAVKNDRRDVAAALARRFNDLSQEDIEHFRKLLSKGKHDD